jgi:hypothetical protein
MFCGVEGRNELHVGWVSFSICTWYCRAAKERSRIQSPEGVAADLVAWIGGGSKVFKWSLQDTTALLWRIRGSATVSGHTIHNLAFLFSVTKTSKLYNILGEFLFLNLQIYYISQLASRYLEGNGPLRITVSLSTFHGYGVTKFRSKYAQVNVILISYSNE